MVHKPANMKFTPQIMLSAPRRSAGVPNASGTKVLYTTSTYSFETHKKELDLRVLDVKSGDSFSLAENDEISDLNWLDEDNFTCLQAEKDGTTSVYVASVSAIVDGGKAEYGKTHYVAGKIDGPAGNLRIAKLDSEGDEFAVVISAQAAPDGSLFNPNKAPKTQSTGRLFTSLYVRHWDRYETKDKTALFYGKLSKPKGNSDQYTLSKLTNALKDTGLESPIPTFGGTDHFDICSNCIIFVAKDPDLNPALNTKCNVYIIHMSFWDHDDPAKPQQVIVPGFEGACTSPVVSSDGRKAAFLSMKQNGYEADKNHIFVLPDLKEENLVPLRAFSAGSEDGGWDRSPSTICFSADGESLLAVAEDLGHARLFTTNSDLTEEAEPRQLTSSGFVTDVKPLIGGQVFISGTSLIDNSYFAVVDPFAKSGESTNPDDLTTWMNSNSGGKLGLHASQVSSIWTPANNRKVNKEVHSWVLKPSNFDSNKKYPVAYLIHGGPQGSWADSWSTRWNPAVFAEQGYIVIAPNITGSTGYGQKFTDSIRRNWGGDPYEDIGKLFEWVTKNMPEADNDKAVALGASFGGYMMNWIQGHDLGRKFKALVCHDGIFGVPGMLATEELYFPFRDLGGTPWYDPGLATEARQAQRNFGALTKDNWKQWDPSEHLANWSTPQLVIHSSKDYRICISDGLAAFNVLQARGVESQLLTFPDENHFVLKPENSLVWHRVVLNFINKRVGLPAFTKQDVESEAFWGGERGENEQLVEMMSQGKPET